MVTYSECFSLSLNEADLPTVEASAGPELKDTYITL